MKTIIKLFISIFAFLNTFFYVNGQHPRVHTQEDLQFVKSKVEANQQPWKDAYDDLILQANKSLSHSPQAVEDFDVKGYYSNPNQHNAMKKLISEDAMAAYYCALAYHLARGSDASKKDQYGNKAIEILNDWANNNTDVSGGDGNLVMSYNGHMLGKAGDLMHSTALWSSTERDKFDSWVKNVLLKSAKKIYKRHNNWGDWGTISYTVCGLYLDDTDILEELPGHVEYRILNAIDDEGWLPSEKGRGDRGMWYTYFALAPMTEAAHFVRKHLGVDLFDPATESGAELKRALEFYYGFCQNPSDWPNNQVSLPQVCPECWPMNLYEAMAEMYNNQDYENYIIPARPIRRINTGLSWSLATLFRGTYLSTSLPAIKERVAKPTANPAGNVYNDSVLHVELSCETSGASIFYTMDGSMPNESSTLYTGPITLTESIVLQAIAYKDTLLPSQPMEETYTFYIIEGGQLIPVGVTASDDDGNLPENTVDGLLDTRWSASGNNEWMQYELAAVTDISSISIAWYIGDTRQSFFEIQVSDDGSNWTTIRSDTSSGTSLNLETYTLNTKGRYLRILGHGNSKNSWNSITEVKIYEDIVHVTGVTANPESLTVLEGETVVITSTVNPSNASDKSVSWSSSNTSVAMVDASGKVTAVAPGSATITVETTDGGFSATTIVTVSEAPIGTIPVSLRIAEGAVLVQSMNNGDIYDLSIIGVSELGITADVTGVGSVGFVLSGEQTISQTENNPPYSMTSDAGGNLNSWNATPGDYVLTVTTYSESSGGGNVIDQSTISFSIIDGSLSTVDVTGVNVSPTSLVLTEGEAGNLTATVSPVDATDKSVSWSSSNISVATVDASGKVKSVSTGTALITVTTNDGSHTATCNVTVNEAVQVCTALSQANIKVVSVSNSMNTVSWDIPTNAEITDVVIYRESNVIGIFDEIGMANVNDASYIDVTSNSNDQSYEYKVAWKNQCDQVSELSNSHKTIHLTASLGMGANVNLAWNHYKGITYSTYNIYRGTDPASMSLLTSMSASNTTFTDSNAPSGMVYYMIETASLKKAGSELKSTSNIADVDISTEVKKLSADAEIKVWPNPCNQILNISGSGKGYIADMQGKRIMNIIINNETSIDISLLNPGIYMLVVDEIRTLFIKQ
jgi:uncharacterized protein YjdB